MRIRRRDWPAEDFQMAPMIDMVFLLLVFFMCVSSLAIAEKSRPVNLPESAESKVPDDLRDRVTITVGAGGDVFIGAEPVELSVLARRLQEARAGKPAMTVQVRADKSVPFGEVKKVLRTCAEAGAFEVVYATHQMD